MRRSSRGENKHTALVLLAAVGVADAEVDVVDGSRVVANATPPALHRAPSPVPDVHAIASASRSLSKSGGNEGGGGRGSEGGAHVVWRKTYVYVQGFTQLSLSLFFYFFLSGTCIFPRSNASKKCGDRVCRFTAGTGGGSRGPLFRVHISHTHINKTPLPRLRFHAKAAGATRGAPCPR